MRCFVVFPRDVIAKRCAKARHVRLPRIRADSISAAKPRGASVSSAEKSVTSTAPALSLVTISMLPIKLSTRDGCGIHVQFPSAPKGERQRARYGSLSPSHEMSPRRTVEQPMLRRCTFLKLGRAVVKVHVIEWLRVAAHRKAIYWRVQPRVPHKSLDMEGGAVPNTSPLECGGPPGGNLPASVLGRSQMIESWKYHRGERITQALRTDFARGRQLRPCCPRISDCFC